MAQCITYTVKNGLYINITNRCTCACDFCERGHHNSVGDAESLWLEYEPSREEVFEKIAERNLEKYDELVFCGFGEPTLRLDDLLWVAQKVKGLSPLLPIRINTNGHANMIAGYDVTPKLAGLIDALSISLNRPNAKDYTIHMRPIYGEAAFDGLLDFSIRAKKFVPHIVLSVVDILSETDLETCKSLTTQLDIPLLVREYH